MLSHFLGLYDENHRGCACPHASMLLVSAMTHVFSVLGVKCLVRCLTVDRSAQVATDRLVFCSVKRTLSGGRLEADSR